MKTPNWIKMRKRSEPELVERPPIWLKDHSNGEYYHFQTPYERKLERFIMQKADENARKIGMPRRDFLQSAMGMVTSMWCINYASGCSSNDPKKTVTDTRPEVCKAYDVVPEQMFDEQAACAAIKGNEFIFDIQTHFFDPNGEWTVKNPGYVTVVKLIAGQNFDMNTYLDTVFCQSDTKMAVLSTWPGALCTEAYQLQWEAAGQTGSPPCGLPMSTEEAARSRDLINQMAESRRLLSHAMILPNDPAGVEYQMQIMEATACTVGVAAWKLYPAWGPAGVGWFLDDPQLGIPIIEKGLQLGVKTFCAHKGLPIPGFDVTHNIPTDVGPVAAMYPEANFIIYHASIRANGGGGEYEYIENDDKGVNALITSMRQNGIGPNQNVFAELGSSWSAVMYDTTQAAHYLGKLMKYVGEDNVCWGTDSIVYGSPQPQIELLRNMTIPVDMQTQFGYPELTPERKAKIFGLNSARVYGVDPTERHCQVPSCPVAQIKENLDAEFGERRWAFQDERRIRSYDDYVENARESIAKGSPA